MRELTMFETQETAGGLLPVLAALVVAVVGHYIYDPVGPKKDGGENRQDESGG